MSSSRSRAALERVGVRCLDEKDRETARAAFAEDGQHDEVTPSGRPIKIVGAVYGPDDRGGAGERLRDKFDRLGQPDGSRGGLLGDGIDGDEVGAPSRRRAQDCPRRSRGEFALHVQEVV